MSAQLMQKAWEIAESDSNLTPVDKLLLLKWAWKTRDGAEPYEIKFRTVARELGVTRNAVKASVKRLEKHGYLMTVSVKVVAGHVFQTKEGSLSDPFTEKETGHSVTPDGSLSDPQKGHSVTPIKRKKKNKRASARADEIRMRNEWLQEATGKPFDEWRAQRCQE